MEIELTIRHIGLNWVVNNEDLNIAAPTLEELDQQIINRLKEKNLHKEGSKTRVFMFYDNSTIPQWIRQYAQHYFNRILEIED
jgi:hypothetical protein